MGWTVDQQKAIDTDTGKGNILVSAAAGSGKTAVLVERVIQKILSGKSAVDRLLIVTFTEAAASEMKEKIIKKLISCLDSPDYTGDTKKYIKTQIRMTETADIMTIDAFCNRVVGNNFHILGIDPNIRICDKAMAKLIGDEAMENTFSGIYKSDDPEIRARFSRLCDYYAKDRSNQSLADMIMTVHKFAESFPQPMEWVKEAANSFKAPIMEWPSVIYHQKASRNAAKQFMALTYHIVDNTQLPPAVTAIAKTLTEIASRICSSESWDDIYAVYKESFGSRKTLKAINKALDELPPSEESDTLIYAANVFIDTFRSYRTDDKAILGICQSAEETKAAYNPELLSEEAEDIAWIVGLFHEEFMKLKEKKGVYEFSDIEHMTYDLFSNTPSVREAYTDKYDEILIDEYQDTNMLQDSIFRTISHNNIFMVGDLKQSIYRFRKGDPYIFKDKSNEYSHPDSAHTQIMLSQNFRSRQEVLGCVNDLFSKIMSENAGDVNYLENEYITREKDYEQYPDLSEAYKAELHYLSVDQTVDRVVYEAQYTARKIKELLSSDTLVYDKDTKVMRPIQKRDIVILENSVKYNCAILTDELAKQGIDSYADTASFFDRREISVMMSLLSLIDNSHRDIPLISVMKSPIGAFSDNDLAKIRIHSKKTDYFIDAVAEYGKSGTEASLALRCNILLSNLRKWRGYTRKKSVAQLIWAIYEETYFYDMMGAIDGGEESQANLRLLYERAKDYESTGFRGLFNFNKYLEHLEEDDNELSGAKFIGEAHDVVRIMTIHKSKGLEFPYVFLLGMGRDFPPITDNSLIAMHKELGFGLPHIYYDKHYSQDTYSLELIRKINRMESASERMRLLYVALTRPREKLYVVVARRRKEESKEELIESWKNVLVGNKLIPKYALEVKGFYGWLCPAVAASPDTWSIHYRAVDELFDTTPQSPKKQEDTYEDSEYLRESVNKILDYSYPYADSSTIPSRTSVTQLKERTMAQSADDVVYEPESRQSPDFDSSVRAALAPLKHKPSFMEEDGTKPANEIGTLYHLVMSEINMDKVKAMVDEGIDTELDRLVCEDIISKNDIEYIDRDKIKAFFRCDLAERIFNSKNVQREKPFQINISALEYDPSLPAEYKDETVILQGIIDCFFEEEDGFVLLDYKTDKVKNPHEIRQKYEKQLELYTEAIEKLTGKCVKESYLYLFDTGEIV